MHAEEWFDLEHHVRVDLGRHVLRVPYHVDAHVAFIAVARHFEAVIAQTLAASHEFLDSRLPHAVHFLRVVADTDRLQRLSFDGAALELALLALQVTDEHFRGEREIGEQIEVVLALGKDQSYAAPLPVEHRLPTLQGDRQISAEWDAIEDSYPVLRAQYFAVMENRPAVACLL